MKTLLLTILIIGISILFLGIKVFFVKGGKFPNTHIHNNSAMQKNDITCVYKDVLNK